MGKGAAFTRAFGSVDALEAGEKRAIFRIQTGVFKALVDRLVGEGFCWILPVMLAKSVDPLWPDADASIEKRLELEIYGETVKTMQSMIVHKRVLVSLGPERFFTLSPNIRIEARERAKTGKHLYEFTQLDLEMANAKMPDIFRLFEELIGAALLVAREKFSEELGILDRHLTDPETPYRVYQKDELEKSYGKGWVDAVSEKSSNPVWVENLPREFYDYEDEDTGVWRNFDLIMPEGYGEVISGAEREHEYKKIVRKLERDRLDKKDFELLLRLAKDGRLKPSAGAGLGLERFISYICGTEHVAEVQPFPRIPGTVPEL